MWWCCSNSVSPLHNVRKELSRSNKISSSGCQIKPLICFTSGAAGPFVHLLFVSFGNPTLSSMLCVLRRRSYCTSSPSLEDSPQMFPGFWYPDQILHQTAGYLSLFFVFILITAYCFVMSIVGLSVRNYLHSLLHSRCSDVTLEHLALENKEINSDRRTLKILQLSHTFDWVQFNIACVLCFDVDVDLNYLQFEVWINQMKDLEVPKS